MTQRFQVWRGLVTALCLATFAFPAVAQGTAAEAAPVEGSAAPTEIVAFGDSLTAGFGVGPGESFPEQLQAALTRKGYAVAVANAGVSGDTTTGGRDRLDWSVPPSAKLVILELGANDALRGIPPRVSEANLDAMLQALTTRGTKVILAGMLAPPNMGPDYAAEFDPIYERLAEKYRVPLYPFFLDGVAARSDLNQPDGMHPTKAGVAIVVERILPTVESALGALGVAARQG